MKKGNIKSLVAMLCVTAVGVVPVVANAFDNGVSTSISNSTSVSAIEYELGDVNMDGKVDLDDTGLVLGAALEIVEEKYQEIINDEQKAKLADMNQDGKIDLTDANMNLRVALAIVED